MFWQVDIPAVFADKVMKAALKHIEIIAKAQEKGMNVHWEVIVTILTANHWLYIEEKFEPSRLAADNLATKSGSWNWNLTLREPDYTKKVAYGHKHHWWWKWFYVMD